MARTLVAALPAAALPDRKPLQAAIDALGGKCRLDPDYAPDFSGYLACDLDGEDAGFTLKLRPGEPPVATLSWGGDPREEAAACLFCAALAQDFGAAVTRDGAPLTPSELLAAAQRALA